jgi:hypothetical protein
VRGKGVRRGKGGVHSFQPRKGRLGRPTGRLAVVERARLCGERERCTDHPRPAVGGPHHDSRRPANEEMRRCEEETMPDRKAADERKRRVRLRYPAGTCDDNGSFQEGGETGGNGVRYRFLCRRGGSPTGWQILDSRVKNERRQPCPSNTKKSSKTWKTTFGNLAGSPASGAWARPRKAVGSKQKAASH